MYTTTENRINKSLKCHQWRINRKSLEVLQSKVIFRIITDCTPMKITHRITKDPIINEDCMKSCNRSHSLWWQYRKLLRIKNENKTEYGPNKNDSLIIKIKILWVKK